MLIDFLRKTKSSLVQCKYYNKTIKKLMRSAQFDYFEAQKGRFILFGSPEYNNLGDHAIAWAMKKFLKENFDDVEIVEITEKEILTNFNDAIQGITQHDVICLVGGGNLGNQYQDQRIIRNLAIKTFTKNKIVIFPQSIYYTKDVFGKNARKIDNKIFQKHPNLHIFARDYISKEIMESCFPKCKVYCTPDIVLSIKLEQSSQQRNGGLICLRNDVEGSLSNQEKNEIGALFSTYETIDTCLPKDINVFERESAILNLLDKIAKAEIVITDRLHGVIFCAITRTPCIVFNNYNHKIKGIMDWLTNNSQIRLCDDYKKIKEVKENLCKSEDKLQLEDKFMSLREVLGRN